MRDISAYYSSDLRMIPLLLYLILEDVTKKKCVHNFKYLFAIFFFLFKIFEKENALVGLILKKKKKNNLKMRVMFCYLLNINIYKVKRF